MSAPSRFWKQLESQYICLLREEERIGRLASVGVEQLTSKLESYAPSLASIYRSHYHPEAEPRLMHLTERLMAWLWVLRQPEAMGGSKGLQLWRLWCEPHVQEIVGAMNWKERFTLLKRIGNHADDAFNLLKHNGLQALQHFVDQVKGQFLQELHHSLQGSASSVDRMLIAQQWRTEMDSLAGEIRTMLRQEALLACFASFPAEMMVTSGVTISFHQRSA